MLGQLFAADFVFIDVDLESREDVFSFIESELNATGILGMTENRLL